MTAKAAATGSHSSSQLMPTNIFWPNMSFVKRSNSINQASERTALAARFSMSGTLK